MRQGGRKSIHAPGAALFAGIALIALAGPAGAAADVHSFDIPAQEAGKSIPEFARQAGRQIVAPGEDLRGVRTPAVLGTYDVDAALARLLKGTNLAVVSDNGQVIILAVRQQPSEPQSESAALLPGPFETVVVTGFRASLADSTNSKKTSVGFSDTIFAEDTGKFPDTNIAEAFNRIPGITISRELDGSGVNVSIRGLGSNFTKVLLNGTQVAVASTGPTNYSNPNRETDLNIFPVELFTQLTVNKSPRASQLEGGAAGAIDMRSARPFDNPGLHLTYSLKGSLLSSQGALGPNGALIVSDTTGPFGALIGVTGTATRFFTTGFESVGWTIPNLLTDGSVVQCAPASTCNALGNGNWIIPPTVPANVTTGGLLPGERLDQSRLLALNPGLFLSQLNNMLLPRLGRPFMEKGVRSRYNGVVSVEYRPSHEFHFYFDAIGARLSNAFDRADVNWIIRNGAAIPINVQVDRRGVVTSGLFANAQWFLEARPYHERGDFISVNPGFEWQPNALLQVSMQANASRSHFLRVVPSIVMNTVPSAGNPPGVPGPAPPVGGAFVSYSNPAGAPFPVVTTNIDLNDPTSYQWAGGRVNAQAEKRYTFTNGVHADVRYGGEELNFRAGFAFDDAYRKISAYDNSFAWQNAVCGDNPNIFLPLPNDQTPCQGLNVAGSATAVSAVASGYPDYPGLGTNYSAGFPALSYQGSLVPAASIAGYLKPGPFGFVNVDYGKFFAASHYRDFAYPNTPVALTSNLAVSAGTIDEKNYGLYGELNGILDLAGRGLRFNAGLRWIETLQSISAPISAADPRNSAMPPPADGGRYPNIVAVTGARRSYQAFLPALNLVYEVAEEVRLHASLSRTMTRPDPSSVLPGVNFSDPSAAQATIGNPALRPYFSNNIDLGLELYTGGEGYIGFTAFRKGLSGFTTRSNVTRPFTDLAQYGVTYANLTRTQRDAIDARGGPSVATIIVSQQINASGLLTINGLELSLVQPLDFLLADYGLNGFGVMANFTVVDQKGTGSAPAIATGISPFTYNLTGYYENHGLSVRLSYVFNDRQFMTGTNQNGICLPSAASTTCPGGAYLYTNAYAQLDLGSSFKLAELFGDMPSNPEITFDVQNLTKSKLRGYFQYPQATYAFYSPGTTYIFGLRGTF